MRLAQTLLVLSLAAPALAQAPDPPGPAAAAPGRDAHRARLEEVVVHLEFRRAPLEDILVALERATGVPVRLGDAARRALERRRFRMRYVADRTGAQAVEDLARAAALDAEVTAEGVVFDTPAQVRRLRERLGLPARAVRLRGEDVARLLDTKRLTLTLRDRPLEATLEFLRAETGVRFVVVLGDGEPAAEPPRVTLEATDVTLRAALDLLLEPAGWGWTRQGSVVLVGPAEVVAAQQVEEEEDR